MTPTRRRRALVEGIFEALLDAAEREGINERQIMIDLILDDPENIYRIQESLNKRLCAVCGVRRGSPHLVACGLKQEEWPE
jgi:hypothetical protein